MTDESTEVTRVNDRFYWAHENRSFDAMSEVWSQGPDVVCIHPGWPILRGWPAVGEAWRRILEGPGHNQFITTNSQVNVAGIVAWVTLDENLMASGQTGTVAATNVFLKIDGEWKMVHHHGSPVASQPAED